MGKRRLFFVALCILLVAGSAPAAPGDIRTIAGGGLGDGGAAKGAILSTPWAFQLAPDGSLLVADMINNRIRRITPGADGAFNGDPSETISTIAGNGENRSAGDGGPASASSMYFPRDLAFDPAGNLYIAESNAGRIRMIDAATNTISTFAGGGTCCTAPVDGGPAIGGYLNAPDALHWSGDALYIGTGYNIYRVASGVMTRVGGGTSCSFGGDIRDGGPARDACFVNIYGLTTDAHGALFVSDSYNNRIRRIETGADGVVDGDPEEIISTVAGNGDREPADDSKHPKQQACLYTAGLDFDAAGNLVFAEQRRIRKLSPGADGIVNGGADETVTTIAGDLQLTTADGYPANFYDLQFPRDVDVLADGRILFADTNNHKIRVIDTLGITRVVAGNRTYLGDGGPATAARLTYPAAIARVGDNLYIGDSGNLRVRRVDSAGVITTVAGGAAPVTGNGDGGHPRDARFGSTSRMATDAAGNLYVADWSANRLRKITAGTDGVVNGGADERITTLAGPSIPGTGTAGFFPTQVSIRAVAAGGDGSVFFSGPYAVWRAAPDGSFARVAGTGVRGSWGDCNEYSCNPAIEAGFTNIGDLAIDGSGRMYVVDGQAARIRLIVPGGDGVVNGGSDEYVYTVAGSCRTPPGGSVECSGFAGDGGPATSALLEPSGVSIGTDGSLYIADSGNSCVRRVTPGEDGFVNGGEGEIISTIAGTPNNGGFFGDGGPATGARFNGVPTVLAGPSSYWIADSSNHRIREVEL